MTTFDGDATSEPEDISASVDVIDETEAPAEAPAAAEAAPEEDADPAATLFGPATRAQEAGRPFLDTMDQATMVALEARGFGLSRAFKCRIDAA